MPYALWLALASIALYGLYQYLLCANPPGPEQLRSTLPMALIAAYISVWMTSVGLSAGIRWLNRSNAVMRSLSSAAYWTYLIHLPLLFAIQYLLMDLDWPWSWKLLVSTGTTLALCLLSYPILVRRTPLRRLLGWFAIGLHHRTWKIEQADQTQARDQRLEFVATLA